MYHHPIVVSHYDEILDEDVLRVVKMIRRRAGINSPQESKITKAATATPKVMNDRSCRREQYYQSIPKYNVEVQTDSLFLKEKPSVPSVSITRKFPRKGFRDEFNYVEYEYNDENQLPLKTPTIMVKTKHHEYITSIPRVTNGTKRPPTVDTFIAAQIKDPDSPTRHMQLIEERTIATLSGTSSSASSPSVFHNVISPVETQPFSFVCSTGIGKNFVTSPKANGRTKTRKSHEILASFTEATDNETVDLSRFDDVDAAPPVSFWDGIVARILGAIVSSPDDDDDTVLLTARAKYVNFFDGVPSPLSTMPLQQHATTTKNLDGHFITSITRNQLPPKTRTTLLNDFLDHMLGPDKNEYEDSDGTIAGESLIDDLQLAIQDKRTDPRLLWKSIDRYQSKKDEQLKASPRKSFTTSSKSMSKPISRHSRSALHDIVDQIVGRFSTSNSDVYQHQQSERYLSSTSSTTTSESSEVDDDDESDDDDCDSVTNFITEISIPGSSVNLSTDTDRSDSDSDSISATVLSIGRHEKTKGRWKSANTKVMAFLDELEDDDGDFDSHTSSDSSTFSFEAASFTFD